MGFSTNTNHDWHDPNISVETFRSFIGMYEGSAGPKSPQRLYFIHSFVSVEGVLETEGVDVSILYQMGDEDSNWEGVHIEGITDGYETN